MDNITWIGSPNHYNGRNGYTINHITLHIMVGTLTGTDSVFQHAGYASAHYGIGSNGKIHQYVSENDGSWSDANYASNNSTISIEHEGVRCRRIGGLKRPCMRVCRARRPCRLHVRCLWYCCCSHSSRRSNCRHSRSHTGVSRRCFRCRSGLKRIRRVGKRCRCRLGCRP